MTTGLRAGLLLALTLPGACEWPTPERDVASIAGCYAFARADSPWVTLQDLMPDTLMFDTLTKRTDDGRPYSGYPHVLRPLSQRPGAWGDSIEVETGPPLPWPPDWERAFVLSAWAFAPPDSVRAMLHENMGPSWLLELEAAGDSLKGLARYYDDTDQTFDVPLVGWRIPCLARKHAEAPE